MAEKKETALARGRAPRDPFVLLRQMTSELDRVFDQPFWSGLRFPTLMAADLSEGASWMPQIDVVEHDGRLITKVDLPGMKKEDVKVEIADGYLSISGERKSATDEKTDNLYRCERSWGSFHRVVPLPEHATLEDVKASFADGVLEVSVPLQARAQAKKQTVQIEDRAKPAKTAA